MAIVGENVFRHRCNGAIVGMTSALGAGGILMRRKHCMHITLALGRVPVFYEPALLRSSEILSRDKFSLLEETRCLEECLIPR